MQINSISADAVIDPFINPLFFIILQLTYPATNDDNAIAINGKIFFIDSDKSTLTVIAETNSLASMPVWCVSCADTYKLRWVT